MTEKWIEDMEVEITNFFKTASKDDIINSLKEAGYYDYTGINPEELDIQDPVYNFHADISSKITLNKKADTLAFSCLFDFEDASSLLYSAADSDVRYALAA